MQSETILVVFSFSKMADFTLWVRFPLTDYFWLTGFLNMVMERCKHFPERTKAQESGKVSQKQSPSFFWKPLFTIQYFLKQQLNLKSIQQTNYQKNCDIPYVCLPEELSAFGLKFFFYNRYFAAPKSFQSDRCQKLWCLNTLFCSSHFFGTEFRENDFYRALDKRFFTKLQWGIKFS